jgi:hypothetical protein
MSKVSRKLSTFIITILIISIGMTLFLFRTNVQAAIFGTKNYYLSLERDNFKDLTKTYKDNYKEKLSRLSYACKVNAKLDGDLMKSDPVMTQIADYISKTELNINYNANNRDLKNTFYTALFSTKYDGKKLLDVDIKSADNKTLIAFPELTEKTLGIEGYANSYKFTEAFLGDDKAFEELFGITKEAYDKMVEKYLKDVIFDQIPDDHVVFNSDADFESIKCNSITFNIDEKIISNIYKAVAKELSNDKEVEILVKSIAKAIFDIANEQKKMAITMPTAEEIEDSIKAFCDELNNEADDMEEVQLVYTAYFKSNGDIISRQFNDKLNDTSGKLSIYKDLSGADIFNLNYKESTETIFELKNKAKLQNGIYDGNLNFDVSGKSLLETKYSFEKDAKVGDLDAFVGEIQGKINLKQFNNNELTGYPSKDLSDIHFSFINRKIDTDTLGGKTQVTSKINGKTIGVTVFTEVKQSNLNNLAKPEVAIDNSIKLTDYTELNEMGTELYTNLQKRLLELIPFPNGMEG